MQLRIYAVSLSMVSEVSVLATRVARHDRDLARQMRRAAMSVPLNIAEGENVRGGHAVARFSTALGSANETIAALDVAMAARYLDADAAAGVRDRLDHIARVLWKLTNRGR